MTTTAKKTTKNNFPAINKENITGPVKKVKINTEGKAAALTTPKDNAAIPEKGKKDKVSPVPFTEHVPVNAEEIGVDSDRIEQIKIWLTETRVSQCQMSLGKWFEIGDICTRIKSSTMAGKFKDNVNTILETEITNDERQYSMKLYDAKSDVLDWYMNTGCLKYNPRTIWSAYATKDEKDATPEEIEEKKAEKKDKELRKERTGADALKSFIEYKKVRNKAGEDGNLVLGDMKTLQKGLEAELAALKKMIKLESAS